jgi:hypothetical protein
MKPTFFSEHPWITLFLGLAVLDGVVTIVRGRDRGAQFPQPPLFAPHTRGTYR